MWLFTSQVTPLFTIISPSPHHHFPSSLAHTHYPLFSPTCPPLLPLISPPSTPHYLPVSPYYPPFSPPFIPLLPLLPPPPRLPLLKSPPSVLSYPPFFPFPSSLYHSPASPPHFLPHSINIPPFLPLTPPPHLPSFSPLLPLIHPPDPLHFAPCSFSLPPILPLIFSPSRRHVPPLSLSFPPLPLSLPPVFPSFPPCLPPVSPSSPTHFNPFTISRHAKTSRPWSTTSQRHTSPSLSSHPPITALPRLPCCFPTALLFRIVHSISAARICGPAFPLHSLRCPNHAGLVTGSMDWFALPAACCAFLHPLLMMRLCCFYAAMANDYRSIDPSFSCLVCPSRATPFCWVCLAACCFPNVDLHSLLGTLPSTPHLTPIGLARVYLHSLGEGGVSGSCLVSLLSSLHLPPFSLHLSSGGVSEGGEL
ncbi:unnamed protein product [Closterium sp. Naga37s-1]|nr:unnamed protein product [Closterium sp. Naga37s-1]